MDNLKQINPIVEEWKVRASHNRNKIQPLGLSTQIWKILPFGLDNYVEAHRSVDNELHVKKKNLDRILNQAPYLKQMWEELLESSIKGITNIKEVNYPKCVDPTIKRIAVNKYYCNNCKVFGTSYIHMENDKTIIECAICKAILFQSNFSIENDAWFKSGIKNKKKVKLSFIEGELFTAPLREDEKERKHRARLRRRKVKKKKIKKEVMTIKLHKDVRQLIEELKTNPKETCDSVISRIIEDLKKKRLDLRYTKSSTPISREDRNMSKLITTIKLSKATVEVLKTLKDYPSEPYEGVVRRGLRYLTESEL